MRLVFLMLALESGASLFAQSVAVRGPFVVAIQGSSTTACPGGASVPFSAIHQGLFAYNGGTGLGALDITLAGTWKSSDPTIAAIDPATGIVTPGLNQGPAIITFTSGTFQASAILTVQNFSYLTIAPLNPSITGGNTQSFAAAAHNCDLTTADVTATAAWSIGDPTLGTVSPGSILTNVGVDGSTTVTASYLGSTATTGLNVGLTSISVSPSPLTKPVGAQIPYTASGSFDDGLTRDVTFAANWGPLGNPVVQINNTGTALALSQGTATITANSLPAMQGTASLTVGPIELLSIDVVPLSTAILNGANQQFTATGNYSDFSTQDLTLLATWTSTDPTKATITSGSFGGVATGDATRTGTTQISAAYTDPNWPSAGQIGTNTPANLTVGAPALRFISISPQNPVINTSKTLQFTATGSFSDGSTQDVTSQANWRSGTPTVATVTNTGLATATTTPGTANITATLNVPSCAPLNPCQDSTSLTVTTATLQSITVSPLAPAIDVASTTPFKAIATYSDTTTKDVTTEASWQSSSGTVATIAANGVASALGGGSSNITAQLSGITSSPVALTVNPPTSLALSPASTTIAKNGTQQFTAKATFADTGTTLFDLTDFCSWSSDAPTVAPVNDSAMKGLAVGLNPGTAHITSMQSGIVSPQASLTVSSAALVSITVAPLNANLPLNLTKQYTASGQYSDSTTKNITNSVTWSSSNPTIAAISSGGLVKAKSVGNSVIKATIGNLSAQSNLNVIF